MSLAVIPFLWPFHRKSHFNSHPNAMSPPPLTSYYFLNQLLWVFHPKHSLTAGAPAKATNTFVTANSHSSTYSNRIIDARFERLCGIDRDTPARPFS